MTSGCEPLSPFWPRPPSPPVPLRGSNLWRASEGRGQPGGGARPKGGVPPVMAGSLKRAEPDLPEDMLLIRAMRDSNLPKFLVDDAILFMALVKDLFPAVEIVDALGQAPAALTVMHLLRRS